MTPRTARPTTPPPLPQTRTHIYGLVVDSEMELYQDRPAPDDQPTDVVITVGEPTAQGDDIAGGRLLLDSLGAVEDDKRYFAVERQDGDQILRFDGACDVEVSADLARMNVRRAVGAAPGMDSVLTSGAALSYQLYRRGHLLLHASGVEVDGRAWAFTGNAGWGKTSVAALLCGEGGELITDDVLRVDLDGEQPVARLGATELRLRSGSAGFVDRFDVGGPGVRSSADHREVLQLSDHAADRLPVAAVVIPQLDRHSVTPIAEALPPRAAVLTLLRFPRLLGWRDPNVLQQQFAGLSELVRRVPVVVVRIPWRQPFADDIGMSTLRAVESAAARVR